MYLTISYLTNDRILQEYHQARDIIVKVVSKDPSINMAYLMNSGLNHISHFRYFSINNKIIIHAIGERAVEYLSSVSIKIQRLLQKYYGCEIQERRDSGFCSIERTERLNRYTVSRMVFFKKHLEKTGFIKIIDGNDVENPEAIKIIKNHIITKLADQAELCGLDFPEEDIMILRLSVEKFQIIKGVEYGEKKFYPFVLGVNVNFAANFQVKGPWSVGLLRARGNGGLRYAHTYRALASIAFNRKEDGVTHASK